jgi:hypothetical protein
MDSLANPLTQSKDPVLESSGTGSNTNFREAPISSSTSLLTLTIYNSQFPFTGGVDGRFIQWRARAS